MTDDKTQSDWLETYFNAALTCTPVPPEAMLERIEHGALAAQVPAPSTMTASPRTGWLGQLWQGLGGWPAIGGLATATVAGVWIGVNPPNTVAVAAESYLGTESAGYFVDFSSEGAFDLAEEAL